QHRRAGKPAAERPQPVALGQSHHASPWNVAALNRRVPEIRQRDCLPADSSRTLGAHCKGSADDTALWHTTCSSRSGVVRFADGIALIGVVFGLLTHGPLAATDFQGCATFSAAL